MKKNADDNLIRILDFVNSEVKDKGYPPSVREICSAVGFRSTSTVHGYLKKLQNKGYILKDPSKPRALKVITNNLQKKARSISNYNSPSKSFYTGKELIDIPLIGKVTAGLPILAVENIEDTYPMPAELVQGSGSSVFMLRVKGDSMIEAGILDNDMVLVRQQSTADNGDIIVALIGDEATIKTFYKEKDHIRLQPQNRYMSPILLKNDISVLGKIIGVFRLM